MHIFEKFSSVFKKMRKHDQILIIISSVCLITGIIWGVIFLANKFTTVVPMSGGSIKYGIWEQPRIVNPVLAQNNDSDNDLIQLIYDGLLAIGPGGEIINSLGSNLTISKDGKIYEVKLNEDVLWHDGTTFTSEDVLFTIDMIQDYRNESPFYNIWKDIRVEKVGDYMVRFYLLQPSSQFKQNLTVKILPKHIWENINPKQYLMTEYNLKPVGTGPYKYKKLVKDKTGKIIAYYLEKNPKYFKHVPYINEVIFNFYDDADAAFKALIRGNIDLIKEISYYQKELIKKRKSIILSKVSLPRYYSIFFNQKNDLWKNPNLIKALELAINKEEAINESLYGEAEILNAPISKNFLGYAEKLNQKIYNKEEAKKILNDLGYTDKNNDGLLEKTTTTGKGKNVKTNTTQLELNLIVPAVNELSQLAQNIKVNLESIGIKTNVTIIPLQDIYKNHLKDRKYDAILFGEAYGLMPDLYLFWHSSQVNDPGLNLAMFSDSNLDRLLEENRYTQDQQVIKDNLIKIQEILSEKKPAIFIANPYFLYAKDKNIKGNILNIINLPAEKFENIEDWYVNTRRKLK